MSTCNYPNCYCTESCKHLELPTIPELTFPLYPRAPIKNFAETIPVNLDVVTHNYINSPLSAKIIDLFKQLMNRLLNNYNHPEINEQNDMSLWKNCEAALEEFISTKEMTVNELFLKCEEYSKDNLFNVSMYRSHTGDFKYWIGNLNAVTICNCNSCEEAFEEFKKYVDALNA